MITMSKNNILILRQFKIVSGQLKLFSRTVIKKEPVWKSPKEPGNKTKGIGDQRNNQDHLDHSTVKISKNT